MPGCAKFPDRAPEASLAVALAALLAILFSATACTTPDSGGAFKLNRVEANWANGQVDVRFEQQLSLSGEARNALVHGVPLTLVIELFLRDSSNRVRVGSSSSSYEIRYLPLSEHYQVSGSDWSAVKTYPRLRHILAELARLELSFDTGALPAGDYELLVRSRLDKQSMPPPMRLPVLFSPQWDHDSRWTSWPLEINPGA